jgi:hypothetical protein
VDQDKGWISRIEPLCARAASARLCLEAQTLGAAMMKCWDRKCSGKIKFNKPVPKGRKPEGKCTVCGQNYIAAYNCHGEMRIIKIN